MKITKSELKEMIREVLREELSNNDEIDKEISSRSYSEKDKHLAKNLAADNEISNKSYSNRNELQEAESSDIAIIGCDLEEIIDNMAEYGRLPKLPYGWFIDDIDETDSDSRIMFSHRRLPFGVCFYCKYYMGSSYDQCKYEFTYSVSIDSTEFEHDSEIFDRPAPERFIERIFEIVTQFDSIFKDSTEKNFVKNLRAVGYKKV